MTQWDYCTGYCSFVENCKVCKKNHWLLNIYDGKHYWLEERLKAMGEQGWELVAVQQAYEYWQGGNPPFWYIFKRPK